MSVDPEDLRAKVRERAEELGVPGTAVGIAFQGEDHYTFHGVTNAEYPSPIGLDTYLPINSTGKTVTATAIMCLVDQGLVDLDERVRAYVPELRLQDEDVAREVTVLHLLNHTAGWESDLFEETGNGDDALARLVEKMADLKQVTPLGAEAAYNNASLSLAGRVIEKATGTTFEQAVKRLLLQPLQLTRTSYWPVEIMTHSFAVGHTRRPDGSIVVVRPWDDHRSWRPMGVGLSMTAKDHLAWARFHLGDGRGPDGMRVLSEDLLRRMQRPTVEAPGSVFGDAVGVSWMLRNVDGVGLVSHGGDGGGHHSGFVMVPERDFAVTVLTNGLDGRQLRDELQDWALETYLGIAIPDPTADVVLRSERELAEYVGRYAMHNTVLEITSDAGELVLNISESIPASAESDDAVPDTFPTTRLGLLPGPGDKYVVTSNPHHGIPGHFVRDESGSIEAIHFGGLLAKRRAGGPGSGADDSAGAPTHGG